MYKNLLIFIAFILFLSSCNGVTPYISVVCEENNIGNSVVKWETAPMIEGHVKVYASTDPTHISENHPIAIAKIADQRMTIVTPDPSKRYYYRLVFNDKYRVKTATRNINIPGIQNLRDLGGYPSYSTKKQVKWGMLYRSAEINQLKEFAYKELKGIGIKTIIDLRSPQEIQTKKPLQPGFNVVHIPFPVENLDYILYGLQNQTILSDTVYRIAEKGSRRFIRNHTQEFRRIFDVLLDEDNYPIVIHGSSGKGRIGLVAALILTTLEINNETILEDYLLSNKYFNITKFSKFAYQLPPSSQEAITTLLSARECFLLAAQREAEMLYGDIDTYLTQGIGLKKEEIKKLQRLLLEKKK